MSTVTIHVTAADIECGLAGSCQSCPVARAMSIALKRPVSVDGFAWKFVGCLAMNQHNLPVAVTKWIADFDDENPVKPFSFDVEVPA